MILISFVFMLVGQIEGLSYNQPIFCPNAIWNQHATTFSDDPAISYNLRDIFITTSDTVYIPDRKNRYMIIWPNTSSISPRNISLKSSSITTVFVTEDNLIYFDYQSNSISEIRRLSANLSTTISIMRTVENCYDIFIDIYNYIYCSLAKYHQVIRKSLNNSFDQVKIVAGSGVNGSTSFMLNRPQGIFVDINLDLYVADRYNHRIQLFPFGQSDGTTVVGSGSSSSTIDLKNPVAVVLDANRYIFIVDHWNHRIIGSDSNGFRCLVRCNGPGSSANKLDYPRAMSFDKYGNIFVVDAANHRVQKFELKKNSCSKFIIIFTNTRIKSCILVRYINQKQR